jgi:hypothetical protein
MTIEDTVIGHDGRPYLVLRKMSPSEYEQRLQEKYTMHTTLEKDTRFVVVDMFPVDKSNIIEFNV